MFEKWKQQGMRFVRGMLKQYRVITLVLVAAAVGAAGYYVGDKRAVRSVSRKSLQKF